MEYCKEAYEVEEPTKEWRKVETIDVKHFQLALCIEETIKESNGGWSNAKLTFKLINMLLLEGYIS